jgi:uncharacterized protein YkwD
MNALKLTLTLFLFGWFVTNESLYQKLSDLHKADPVLCQKKSKKWTERRPDLVIPHYFLAKIYLDQYTDQQKEYKKYSLLNKSITHALKIQKLGQKDLPNQEEWKSFYMQLHDSLKKYVTNLDEDQEGRRTILNRKAKKLFTSWDLPKKEIKLEQNKEVSIPLRLPGDPLFYGAPLGTERIEPHNLEQEKALMRLINIERKKRGMQSLIWEEDLAYAARYHAFDMAHEHYFSHDSYDVRNGDKEKVQTTFKRIRAFYSASFVNSENIAAGSDDAAGTYRQWYTSKGHNANMFNPSSKFVGIGYYKLAGSPYTHYWVFNTAR